MPPLPLTEKQEKGLFDLYYNRHFVFGRDKLWKKGNEEGLELTQQQTMNWLKRQETWQMYQRPKRERVVRSTIVKETGRVMGIDLADLQTIAWNGYQYILTGIDLFSKRGYARPLKNKRKETVAKEMDSILKEAGRILSVRSDRGSEFINPVFGAVLKKHDVHQVLSLPGKPQSNGQIERFNGILKGMIRKVMRASGSRDWPEFLPLLVENYNNSIHTTTKVKPTVAEIGDEEDNKRIVKRMENKASAMAEPPNFYVGDVVRVQKRKVSNDGEMWSKRLYRINKVLKPKTDFGSVIYRVEPPTNSKTAYPPSRRPDWFGNLYEENLQLVEYVDNKRESAEKWTISKIVKPATRNGEKGYIVRWITGEYSFEPRSMLIDDVPKLVKQFEATSSK
jgi:hypothetical protein